MYSMRYFEREKNVPQHCPIKETIKYVLWSVFSKVISCIQTSMEKSYQSNFVQPSTQPKWDERHYDKGYFSPLTMTYEGTALHVNDTSTKQW